MKAKTSKSDPLRINLVSFEGAEGLIGLTFCPGKRQANSSSGPWERDLDSDLKVIQSFGAKALVTLMEADELEKLKVPPTLLRERTSAFGLEWHHLPIRDVSTPEDHFEDLWTYSGLRLRKLLTEGESLVIHCKGGLGRTGMIGARLLVELGLDPKEAIRRVQVARPGAIETPEQEDHVRRCRKIASPGSGPSSAERFLGCILGGAVGDAFGYCVEFQRLTEIQSRFGPHGIQEPVYQEGKLVVSDDTQMTLFTLEGLLESFKAGASPSTSALENIQRAYLDWYGTQRNEVRSKGQGWLSRQPEMRVPRAPGNTCMSALRAGGSGTIENPINDSKGCGGAMRTAPIGLLPKRFNPEDAFRLAAQAAALTHGHPSGYLSAGMVAAVVRYLVGGDSLETATERSCKILRKWKGYEETLDVTRKAMELARQSFTDHIANVGALGQGWVGEEALAIALYSALVGATFHEVIQIAANHNGDSDSTAAIAGQLWGAWKGLGDIPHEWITRLDILAAILHLVRECSN